MSRRRRRRLRVRVIRTIALVVELQRVLDAVVVLDPVLRARERENTCVRHDLGELVRRWRW